MDKNHRLLLQQCNVSVTYIKSSDTNKVRLSYEHIERYNNISIDEYLVTN